MLAALKLLGSKRLLHIILDEVRQQTEAGNANSVYDVATSLICAPDAAKDAPVGMLDVNGNMPPTLQRPRTLREMLKAEAEGCKKLQKKDAALAEIVVRLHRRVEMLMVMPEAQAMLQTADMALGDAMAAAASGVQGDSMSVDNMLDVGMGGVPSDLGLGPASAGGSLDPSGDNELFGAFGSQELDNFDWDMDNMV